MAWTTPNDVILLWPENSPEPAPTNNKLETYIAFLETQIENRYPTIQERIDNGNLNIDIIKGNVATWIIEYVQRAGSPYSQESMGYTGSANRSVTFESQWRKNLTLSTADLDVFLPRNAGKAFSVDMAPKLGQNRKGPWRTIRVIY